MTWGAWAVVIVGGIVTIAVGCLIGYEIWGLKKLGDEAQGVLARAQADTRELVRNAPHRADEASCGSLTPGQSGEMVLHFGGGIVPADEAVYRYLASGGGGGGGEEKALVYKLVTAKLTHDELLQLNYTLIYPIGVSFNSCPLLAEFYDDLQRQWELQTRRKLPFYTELSGTTGDYGRCPQEDDNIRNIEGLIKILQELPAK